ncbi:serine/threonine-protein kinase [Nocardia sp. NPDC058640]|uniref:serine/threonine-protein kinase n=1 Tax=Nocardia sp. NPDC058640 TaxID=3346571 RepID=UPI003669ED4F
MQPRDRRDPDMLGRYRILAVIGSGGMGRVLLGRAPDGRLVAVKQIHENLTTSAEFRARFEREVVASGRVTGAYTAGVVGHDISAEKPWLASEYIAGPSLYEVVADFGRLSPSGLKLLTIGLAMALLEIHRTGLVHRDLKPSNVLLTNEGPRLIDFGIARAVEGDVSLTATGAVIGSPAYMSPEQAECRPLTAASDVFSAGAVLAMAATGVSPFAAGSTPQTLYNVLYVEPDTSAVPQPFRDIVDACLDKDPARRPTPTELLAAAQRLEMEPVWPVRIRRRVAEYERDAAAWAAGTAVVAPPPSPPQPGRRRYGIRSLVAVALVSVAVLVGSALVGVGMPGNAVAMVDPPLALSDRESMLIDVCALLGPDVLGELGTYRSAQKGTGTTDCSVGMIDPNGKKLALDLSIGKTFASDNARPRGNTIAWLPVQGERAEGPLCDRFVETQSGLQMPVNMQAQGLTDSCPLAERALALVIRRLAVNPPLRKVAAGSIHLVNACEVMDRSVNLRTVGDPAKKYPAGSKSCWVTGNHGRFTLTFKERERVDNKPPSPSSNYKPVDLDGWLGMVDDRGAKCAYELTIKPTRDDEAEMIFAEFDPYQINVDRKVVTDGCERVRAALEPILAKFAKP